MSLDTKLLIRPTCNLVKVASVDFEEDEQEVIGRFGDSVNHVSNPIALCERFLNANSDNSILVFTKNYGPLFQQYTSPFPTGLPFHFPIQKWREFQYDMKSLWVTRPAHWESLSFAVGKNLDSEPIDEYFTFSKKGHRFELGDLSRLIAFFIHTLPPDRQRACTRPECRKYFFATRLDQAYCGASECKRWGQRRSKRDTWNRNKEKYLAQRKREE